MHRPVTRPTLLLLFFVIKGSGTETRAGHAWFASGLVRVGEAIAIYKSIEPDFLVICPLQLDSLSLA